MSLGLALQLFGWIHLINTQTILHSHSSDYTLTPANSPYIVNSYVTFGSNANITIENGVKIILMDHYFISVFGSLNCGCNEAQNKNKGLSNPSLFIHILGNSSMPTSTGIFINQQNSLNPPIISFCNTLFDNIQNGIVTTSAQYRSYTVRNCEFRFINNAIHHSSNMINYVYNSYFHDVNNVKSGGGVIYDNCLFHSFGKFSFNTEAAINIGIRNSFIYGDGVQICLNIYSVAGDPSFAIYNNIISDCVNGIEIWSAVSIRNNSISNCSQYGIYAVNVDAAFDIKYNVFEHNGVFDIYLNNTFKTEIIQNVFDSSIYGINCDVLYIERNHFEALHYDYIVEIEECDAVYILENSFINNDNRYGLIRLNEIENISISYNILNGNIGEYGVKILNNVFYLNFTNNNISFNTVSSHIMYIDDIDYVDIISNSVFYNTATKVISISNTNHAVISQNLYRNNKIDYVVYTWNNDNMLIKHNYFNNNTNAAKVIYISESISTYIGYNVFQNGINTFSVIYFEYLDKTDFSIIEYNDFMTDNNDNNYIYCNGAEHWDYKISAHFNNFYNTENVEYIILSIDVNINANNNYFSHLMTYNDIAQHIYDICIVNISVVYQEAIIDSSDYNKCWWDIINCQHIINYKCDSDTASPTVSPTISPMISGRGIYIFATHNPIINTKSTVDILLFEQEYDDMAASNAYNWLLMVLGSIGITLMFAVFSGILLYIFLKLKRLKEETKHLNQQIKDNKRISIGVDAIERAVFGADSLSDISSAKKKERVKNDEEEKNDTENNDDHSSEQMYCSHHLDEIEGNETYNNDDDNDNYALDGDHMIMNAINTEMTDANYGELSVQLSQSALPHIKNDSNFALKIDIGMVDDIDFARSHSTLSELISEDETSLSSASFTVKTEDEEHKNIDNGYIGLMSPTNTTNTTPQLTISPTLNPDQILHSLDFRNKQQENDNVNDCNTPPGMHSIHKIPKPKTKGQWM